MVTVSVAAGLFSKTVSNWITTYSPAGLPGNTRLKVADAASLAFTAPRDERAAFTECVQLDSEMAAWKCVDALFQLNSKWSRSVKESQDKADSCANWNSSSFAQTAVIVNRKLTTSKVIVFINSVQSVVRLSQAGP